MTNPPVNRNNSLTPQQKIVRRKLSEDMGKILNRCPVTAHDKYARIIATEGDWIIAEQPVRQLPFALGQLISLHQRDVGNSLLEETRGLNNQQIGRTFRTAEVILNGDPDLLDLQARTLAWGVDVAKQVNFKLRHQAKKDPFQTFLNAYDAIVVPIDQVIVHGNESLNSMIWESVVDLLPYLLLETMMFKPGHCRLSHDKTAAHCPELSLGRDMASQSDRDRFSSLLSLYGFETVAYTETVVLTPLLAALRDDPATPEPKQQIEQYQQMFADLLEAYPYLLSSDRGERYMFSVPGTTCMAVLSFLGANGCGRIMVCDDIESLRRGIHTNFVRGALNIGYDGRINWWMHPWRTLDSVFGSEAAVTLSWWILKQVHGQLVSDYLSIEKYYLAPTDAKPVELSDVNLADDTLLYVALAKASETQGYGDGASPVSVSAGGEGVVSKLPQLRRRYFFKLLERCGVEIAQGKGSEIKLLRKPKRPFRLGNHYGSNPSIPSFLAANILKRLEISADDWMDAIAAQ